MEISDAQLERYARHVILEEVGEEGQAKLLASRVLVVGAGGLGSPALLYLAAAGVGHLDVVDDDTVDLTNLQRQVIHTTDQIGGAKTASAATALENLNPETRVTRHDARIDASNAIDLIDPCDLVIDGSDNFATRYLLNDACYLTRTPLISGALLRFEGQLTTLRAWEEGADRPCYRCLFPAPPPAGAVPRCDEAGIFGAVAGVLGTLQASETLKELLGLGDTLAGHLLIFDALNTAFRKLSVKRRDDCALCGASPTLTDLSHH